MAREQRYPLRGSEAPHDASCQRLHQFPIHNKDMLLQTGGRLGPADPAVVQARQELGHTIYTLKRAIGGYKNGRAASPLLECGAFALTHGETTAKLWVCGCCSPPHVAVPATRIGFHGLLFSLQLATIHILLLYKAAPLAPKKRELCLLFINFSHICKHRHRVRE